MINSIFKSVLYWLLALSNHKRRGILIILDSSAVLFSFILALASRLESHGFVYEKDTYIAAALAIAIQIAFFFGSGFYRTSTRHITVNNALTILFTCLASSIALSTMLTLTGLQIPRSVPFIQAAFSIVSMSSLRFFIRAVSQNIDREQRKNIAIYGAGSAGRQLLEALKWSNEYNVCKLIDDNPKLHGTSIAGVMIDSYEDVKKKIKSLQIETILLAMPSVPYGINDRIFELLTETSVNVKAIPDLTSLIASRSSITHLREIDIEDLLGRPANAPDPKVMSKSIIGKTVLVTGAGGSIGSELCRQIVLHKPAQLLIFDVSEFGIYSILNDLKNLAPNLNITPIIGSVRDERLVSDLLKKFPVNTIYHAAAYKHVPLMEQNVMQCILNNTFGTLNLAELAISNKVERFILISTDKAVNPTNYMGASKRLAEMICQGLSTTQVATRFAIVRFGNVLGSSGSVVPLFKKQIAAGGPVTVTHEDVVRFFMTIPEAVQLVIQAGSQPKGNNIFVLDMGKPLKIIDLAKQMITLSGKKPTMVRKIPQMSDEIEIELTGLRPGEKMFEELSYNKNLVGTIHPKIMASNEESIPIGDVKILLKGIHDAIDEKNFGDLHKHIVKVCKDIPIIDDNF